MEDNHNLSFEVIDIVANLVIMTNLKLVVNIGNLSCSKLEPFKVTAMVRGINREMGFATELVKGIEMAIAKDFNNWKETMMVGHIVMIFEEAQFRLTTIFAM
jgi:hypothetical protein